MILSAKEMLSADPPSAENKIVENINNSTKNKILAQKFSLYSNHWLFLNND